MQIETLLGRWLNKISLGLMVMSMLMLAGMTILINVEIVSRSLFKTSTLVADEYSGYFLTWIVLCALTHVQRKDSMLKVDLLIEHLPHPIKLAVEAIAALLCMVVTAILTWATWGTAFASWEFGSTSLSIMETPLVLVQCIMPLGFGLTTLGFLDTSVCRLIELRSKQNSKGKTA